MRHEPLVWVVDDEQSIRWVLERALSREGMSVRCFAAAAELIEALKSGAPDVLLADIRMPGMDGLALLAEVRSRHGELPVIVMTAHSDLDAAVAAYKGGAFEYVAKPFDVDAICTLVRRAAGSVPAGQAQGAVDRPAAIVGEAPAMQQLFRAIGRLSRSQVTVLITGETGSGKELVARALHEHSPRAAGPFIAINTAAIPRELMESELFGHERGAFTGAHSQRKGHFELADGGTLFLDEIGDMPPELQTRLLRVLSDGAFYRVGGTSPIRSDVRVIAATHQDLEAAVAQGRFREDLYHRLNVIRLRVPPLRERREDIPLLLGHFLARAASELGTEPKRLGPEVVSHLSALPWPGNVRQLENLCRWLTVMAPAREVQLSDLPPELLADQSEAAEAPPARADVQPEQWPELLRRWADARLADGADGIANEATEVLERTLIRAALDATAGARQLAARRLGWGRNTLTRKIRALDLD